MGGKKEKGKSKSAKKNKARKNDQVESGIDDTSLRSIEIHDSSEWLPPSDENYLLDEAKKQWQSGEWQKLSNLNSELIENNPDRGKIAILVAAGHQQMNNLSEAKWWVKRARKWNCNSELIGQVLVGGVYNILGNAAILNGHEDRAKEYYKLSITAASRKVQKRIAQNRIRAQGQQAGLLLQRLSDNVTVSKNQYTDSNYKNETSTLSLNENTELLSGAWEALRCGNWQDLAKLDNKEISNHSSRGELSCLAAAGYQQLNNETAMQHCIKQSLDWGYNKQLINQMLESGIQNTHAILSILTGDYGQSCTHFISSLSILDISVNQETLENRVIQQLNYIENIDRQKVLEAIKIHYKSRDQ